MTNKKLSRIDIQQMREEGALPWVTAYDYWTARFAEEAGMDMILVGDSLGMCIYGYEGTVPVTMEQCICHSEAVRRGAPNTFIIGDMPFLSYQVSVEEASAERRPLLQGGPPGRNQAGGGTARVPPDPGDRGRGDAGDGSYRAYPSSLRAARRLQGAGRTADAAMELIEDARAIQEAGAFSLLVEAIPPEVCRIIHDDLKIPVYSIGAGGEADGQVMVCSDILGIFQAFTPKFVKKYDDLGEKTIKAFTQYAKEIRDGEFPEEKHTYKMVEGELPNWRDS